ncbi:MAG: PorP/SprF family type IX secretion system membrane protein [Bacteroidetes bacterium]|nr:PorP/SprF family type IX secretion system membrane protein [Bacteroidota bacterium]
MRRIITFYFLLNFCASFAQDIHFSQYLQSPLTMNPSMAGASKDIQVIVNYKDQWRSVASPYKTYAVSADGKYSRKGWEKGFLGYGINVFRDVAGDANMGTTQANISAAYHVYTSAKSTLGAGLQAGFGQKSIDFSKLQWGNQYDGSKYDPNLPTGEPVGSSSFIYPDFGAGVVWNYGTSQRTISSNDGIKASIGASIYHVNKPRTSFYSAANDKLYQRITVHGMSEIGIKNTNVSLIPSFLYNRQGPSQEIIPGCAARYMLKEDSKYTGFVKGAAVSLGGFYRFKDAFVVTSMLEIANYAFGISYDVNTSSLKEASSGRGGFEICLKYVNPSPFAYRSKPSF